jgi:maltose O-acetyltransferase
MATVTTEQAAAAEARAAGIAGAAAQVFVDTESAPQSQVVEYASHLERLYNFTPLPKDLDKNELARMLSNKIYNCPDPFLFLARQRCHDIIKVFNSLDTPPGDNPLLHQQALIYLLTSGQVGTDCSIEPPIQVDYGFNMTLGNNVKIHSNVVILDCARIVIGDGTVIGGSVKLLGATHPVNPLLRHAIRGYDYGMDIYIGRNCWIGGGSVICPGVTIGDGVVVKQGSVVTKNVPPFVVVEGSPAEVVQVLDRDKCEREEREFVALLEQHGSQLEDWAQDWSPTPVETLTI